MDWSHHIYEQNPEALLKGVKYTEIGGWPDFTMEPEDFESEDKEILSWDINDVKLPQVCTSCKKLPSIQGEVGQK